MVESKPFLDGFKILPPFLLSLACPACAPAMAGWEAFATNDGSTYFCFPQALLAVVTVQSEALVHVFFPIF